MGFRPKQRLVSDRSAAHKAQLISSATTDIIESISKLGSLSPEAAKAVFAASTLPVCIAKFPDQILHEAPSYFAQIALSQATSQQPPAP